MQKITPFLWFDKQCEEAINFYVNVFSSSPAPHGESKVVSIKRYPDGPLEEPMKGMEGKVLTAVFELAGQQFMALDGGPIFKPTSAMSLYIECDSQEEVDHFWNKLSEGGDPNAQQCGWLMDKFGFSWQVIPKALPQLLTDSDKAKADRALQAMLKMKKIDISALQTAANAV
ncbi:MAG TPA: VOC family protein [Patescibacteria group bacterium]|jgi:predicted 3-demethylubiquinone-9 3-methyltransferase (glyoxalase superfamily)|nr:VOC family protein [Patescibacteria group bacterium]